MEARDRQRMLRVAALANKHPGHANAIGVKASLQNGKKRRSRLVGLQSILSTFINIE